MSTANPTTRPVRITALCLLASMSVCACYQYFPVEDVDAAVFYFERSHFRSLEERRFVPLKTAIAVAAVGTGILLVSDWAIGLGAGGESSGPDGGGGGGLNIRSPIPLRMTISR